MFTERENWPGELILAASYRLPLLPSLRCLGRVGFCGTVVQSQVRFQMKAESELEAEEAERGGSHVC